MRVPLKRPLIGRLPGGNRSIYLKSRKDVEFGVDLLLLYTERSWQKWFGHPGRFPLEVLCAPPTGRRPRGKPRTRWREIIYPILSKECLRIPQEELERVSGEKVEEEDSGMDDFGDIFCRSM